MEVSRLYRVKKADGTYSDVLGFARGSDAVERVYKEYEQACEDQGIDPIENVKQGGVAPYRYLETKQPEA